MAPPGIGSNNHAHGGAGSHHIDGAANKDHIAGDHGNDRLQSGHGNDSAIATPGGAVVGVRSSTLIIRGSAKNDHITVKAHPAEGKNGKIDKIEIIERIEGREVKSFYPVNRRIDRVSLEGGAGNDRLQVEGFGADVRDTFNGGDGNDIIIGGNGNDHIHGGKGNDHIHGGAGSDHIRGDQGNDYIAGDRGNDQLRGGTGKDHLSGGIGDDHLFGGKGNDYLAGGMGGDKLRGGKHNDVLSGDGGRDLIAGGEGTDTAVTHSGTRAEGGSGKKDRQRGIENTVDLAKAGSAETTPGGAKVIFFSPKKAGSATLIIRGTDRHSSIIVQAYPDQDKKDERHKKAKIDKVRIEEEWEEPLPGNRTEKKGSTKFYQVHKPIDAVVLEGGAGDDLLQAKGFGADVPVTLSGGKGNDTLVGGLGNDVLNDGAGDDKLFGGGGDDGLTNRPGKDKLYGGHGNDLLVSSSIDEGDLLNGGTGLDNASFAQMPHGSGVRAEIGGTAQRTGEGDGTEAQIDKSIEDLEGSYGDDVLIGDNNDNHLLGRHGRDTLLGRGGNDQLNAKRYGFPPGPDPDRRVDGGPGHDRAILDPEDRRVVRSVEDPPNVEAKRVAAGKPKARRR